jgi:threonine dehydrogenase-like Zn-dependent dehydrogenase
MSEAVHKDLVAHLLRQAGEAEDLCFALWYPSVGARRTTALLHTVVLPGPGDRLLHGNASFLPEYFERALMLAVHEKAGLAFLHSHIGPGWQDMSMPDIRAEEGHAAATLAATGLPFVGLTIGTDGAWSARFWEKMAPRHYERRWCSTVRVVGNALTTTFHDELCPPPGFVEELTRTISAWGQTAQDRVARTHVGIVGLGSVGQCVAEACARTGIARITVADYDHFEFLNLDRSLYGRRIHAEEQALKVDVVAAALRESATARNSDVLPIAGSVVEEDVYRQLLDCDAIIACVDRPRARSILNFIAYAHLIPVIDGGIRVDTNTRGALVGADWQAMTAGPLRPCLECLRQFNAGDVAAERDGYLDDPSYIRGLPRNHALRRNENVFGFSMSTASFQFLQFLALVVAPLGVANHGSQFYHFVPGIMDDPQFGTCEPECLYTTLTAKGDRTGLVVTGRDMRAERMREEQRAR